MINIFVIYIFVDYMFILEGYFDYININKYYLLFIII